MKTILEIALSQYGIKEIAGTKNNPKIIEYHATTGGFTEDEVPWCSSFVNWCAKEAGMERTGKANARSWLLIGNPTMYPMLGDIVVFRRGDNPASGHVGLFISESDTFIFVLGGNQSDEVNISKQRKSDLIGARRLKQI